ncbi:uncharacterized protein LOC106754493 isoform X1 [Vigna radiata var. radiata]|uniref:Uncharacterized protein LOC106754493 isoform X1 n=1 Tax=Vigna radiata var. radiata TaxID=3916 RepID=A0A3Q0EP99_VIGRR|nr:uncharacterized protein LOC106754493 isoform X1 [Vigna radiata var. radiata]
MPEMLDPQGVPIRNVNATHTRVATISVVDHCLPYKTHNLYDVTFETHIIYTLLTSDPSLVHSWISTNVHSRQTGLMVGLDIEWRPNTQRNVQNPVATLQLCFDQHCLVFQILHSPSIPPSLVSFLSDPNVTFFGVGIEDDAKKLLGDFNLRVLNIRDLRSLAAEKLRDTKLNRAGIKSLGLRVLGLEVEKPKRITRSWWDNPRLTPQQVQYAVVDAFLSYEIGRSLSVMTPRPPVSSQSYEMCGMTMAAKPPVSSQPYVMCGIGMTPRPPAPSQPYEMCGLAMAPRPPVSSQPSDMWGIAMTPRPLASSQPSEMGGIAMTPKPLTSSQPYEMCGLAVAPTPPVSSQPSEMYGIARAMETMAAIIQHQNEVIVESHRTFMQQLEAARVTTPAPVPCVGEFSPLEQTTKIEKRSEVMPNRVVCQQKGESSGEMAKTNQHKPCDRSPYQRTGASSSQPLRSQSMSMKCYRCKRSHLQGNCHQSAEKKCFVCQKEGHYARVCPNRKGPVAKGVEQQRGENGGRPQVVQKKCRRCDGPHMVKDCHADKKSDKKCYVCRSGGHLARDCPTRGEQLDAKDCQQPTDKKCYRCQRGGHIARDCPTRGEQLDTGRVQQGRVEGEDETHE